jgi:hypothetical protein
VGIEEGRATPAQAALRIAPNPVVHNGSVQFSLARSGQTVCAVYDAGGRLVRTLWDGSLEAGRHELGWNAAGLAPGAYIVRLDGAAAGAARAVKSAR